MATHVEAPARTQAQKEERFLQWLTENGAVFPKLQWPVLTENGLRGVVALEDIAANEPMLQIPAKLVISEQRCWEDPRLKDILETNRDVFSRDDPVLALFLVQEMLRGDDSFFEPYLSILPYPESIQDWSDDELAELRDRRLVDAAKRRRSEIDTFYDRVFILLDAKYPGVFPREQYTRDKFAFAWKTIQARTFGRRLPWTALVPFADCLNHRNVATKYDFNVDNNGMFRLFPSSTNTYAAGAEVSNSYGRRSNFQLLLDYGFVLPENEWDYMDIDLPKDAMGKRFPFLRRLQFDRRSFLEDLFPVSVLGLLSPAPSPPTSPSESEAKAAERVALQAGYEWLRGVMLTASESLGSSIEDIKQQLHRPDVPERRRDALIYRVSRMKIIQHVVSQIDTALHRISINADVVNTCALDTGMSSALESLDLNSTSAQSSST